MCPHTSGTFDANYSRQVLLTISSSSSPLTSPLTVKNLHFCDFHELMQALQCLVNILRSLVEWYTAGMPAEQPAQRITAQSVGEDNVQSWENLTSSGPSQLFNEAPAEDGAEPGSPLRPTLRKDTSVLQSMMMSTGTLVSLPPMPVIAGCCQVCLVLYTPCSHQLAQWVCRTADAAIACPR